MMRTKQKQKTKIKGYPKYQLIYKDFKTIEKSTNKGKEKETFGRKIYSEVKSYYGRKEEPMNLK